jgi:hypothetical protein
MSAQIILSEPKLYPAMNQQDDVMIIDCGKISDKFEKIILKTTTEAIEKTERLILKDTFTKPEIFPVLLEIYKRNIFTPSGKYMFKQYQEQSKDYENWGADIILYFIVRKILYNEKIPLTKNKKNKPNQPPLMFCHRVGCTRKNRTRGRCLQCREIPCCSRHMVCTQCRPLTP